MADQPNMLQRLNGLIPSGWFGAISPVRDAVHGGLSDSLLWAYGLLQIAKATTRRSGTTGWLLDLDAYGFFGSDFLRRSRESDDSWRKRYTDEIFRPRVTRAAISKALLDETGRAPIIIEPWNTGDCGALDVGTLALSGAQVTAFPIGAPDSPYSGLDVGIWATDLKATQSQPGFSGAGCLGSLELPFQMFVTAYRQIPTGTPYIGGLGSYAGALDSPTLALVGDDTNDVLSSDAEIYAAINRTKAAGITAWTQIQS